MSPVGFKGKKFPFAPEDYSPYGHHRIGDPFATYFLTLAVTGHIDLFAHSQCRSILLESLDYCRRSKGMLLFGYVVMSTHLHLLASASEESRGLSGILQDFKRHTSKRLVETLALDPAKQDAARMLSVFSTAARNSRGNSGYQVWRPDNRPIYCRSLPFLRQKLNYIHMNPVKAGIAAKAADYQFSSARNYAERSDYLLEVNVLDLG